MLVNKTVEFFLSEAAGWGWMPARAEAGTGSETKLRVYCCEKQDGTGGGAGDQITWAGSGLGAARDRTRCRRGPRLEPGLGRDTGGAEAEQAARKSTQKKALYNILQQSWIFQIFLSCNDQIAVLQKSRIMVNLNFSSIIFIVFRITFLSKMLPKCYRPV